MELLKDGGHDVCTVRQQHLEGASDQILFDACVAEGRALITLDHDFGQVLRFPPQRTSGIAILELGPHPSLQSLLGRIRELVEALKTHNLEGALWIVEPGRIRFHLNSKENEQNS